MPLLWTTLTFLFGILLGKWVPLPAYGWAAAAGGFLAWLVVDRLCRHAWWHKYTSLPPALLLLLICLGGLRITLAIPVVDETSLADYNDQGSMRLTGWVVEPPDARESVVYVRLRITELEKPVGNTGELVSLPVKGDCLVRFPASSLFRLGDMIQFHAEPRTPAEGGDFSYREYLSRQGILSVAYYPGGVKVVGSHPVNPLRVWLEDLRQKARQTIFALFPQPESGLLSGILLGLDNDLPASLQQAYRDTGTAHIIAISGFNMAVLAGLLIGLSSRAFNRYIAVALTALGLALYSLLVGGSPSVVRAAVMAIVAMGGHLIGRHSTGPTALCFTAAMMCLINPFLPWDASFQLSFAATSGLVLLGSPLKQWSEKVIGRFVPEEQIPRFSGPLSEYVLFTLAAQFATLPVIALQFKRFSLSSLLSNPLVLPVQPAVLVTGGLTTMAGMVFEPLGKLGAFVAWPLLAYTNKMVEWISKRTLNSFAVDQRLALGIAVFSLLALLIFLFRRRLEILPGRLPFVWICLVLMTAAIAVWTSVLHQPDGRLHLKLISDSSDVTLVVTAPDAATVVLDPGEGINELTSSISQSFSPWRNRVDAVLITDRIAARNVGGFDERLPIQTVYLAPSLLHSTDGLPPVTLDPSMHAVALAEGQGLAVDDNLELHLLAADDQATALILKFRECRILVPGGIDPARLRELDPTILAGLTAIVLTPADITRVPSAWWGQFHASQILWQDLSRAPETGWISLGGAPVLEFVSDGNAYSIVTH